MATVACDNEEGLISVMYDSPLGPIRISADLDGIVEVNLQFGGKYLSKLSKVQTTAASQRRCLTLEQLSSCSDGGYQLVHIRNCVKWFDVYFKGDFDQLKNVVFPQLKPLLSDDELGEYAQHVRTVCRHFEHVIFFYFCQVLIAKYGKLSFKWKLVVP